MLSEFEHRLYRDLGRMKAARHKIKLNSAREGLILSARYEAGPCAQKFENQEVNKMLAMDVIDPAET